MTAGIGLFGWSWLPAAQSYATLLQFGSVACISLSVGMWFALLLTGGPANTADQRKFMGVMEAGAWFYKRAPAEVRETITQNTPSIHDSVEEGAAAFVKTGAIAADVPIYARRGVGPPMEVVARKEVEFTSFESLFGKDGAPLHDVSIRRRDLRKVLRYYKS